jgi:hypothetical protein
VQLGGIEDVPGADKLIFSLWVWPQKQTRIFAMEPAVTKSTMNELLLSGALDYLDSCPGMSIEANFNPPIVPAMIKNWESINGRKLPQDLYDFLTVTDGFSVCWSASLSFDKLGQSWSREQIETIKMGRISINSLQDMVLRDIGDLEAFEIQDSSPFGKVCVVYSDNDKTSIQLWLNGEWSFLAQDFSSYFRLQVYYLGIKGWQMSRTRDGMPQDSSDWLSFYVPHSRSAENVVPKKELSMDKIHKLISIMESRKERK